MKKLLWIGVALICGQALSYAVETNVTARTLELEGLVANLNRKPTDAENWMGNRPAWYDTNSHKALEVFIQQHPDTGEAITAKLWLTLSRTKANRHSVQASIQNAGDFQRVITNAPNSWEAKAARISRCSALFLGEKWDEFDKEVHNILVMIDDYTNEKSEGFHDFLKVAKTEPTDIEPSLRKLLVIGACHEGKLDKALKCAEELQSKFPEWGNRNNLPSQISTLKRGESPFGPPR